MNEAMAIDTPLTDPNLSKVTELLMKRDIIEKPSDMEALTRNVMIASETHSNQLLQQHKHVHTQNNVLLIQVQRLINNSCNCNQVLSSNIVGMVGTNRRGD